MRNLITGEEILLKAKIFVVAAGAVLTPQLLYASNIHPPAMGKYLCEQPMGFCQVILSTEIVEYIKTSNSAEVKQHIQENPTDPLPIPIDDPNPQVTQYNRLRLIGPLFSEQKWSD